MLCLGLALAQEGGNTKRLRFRRPRPQVTDVENPEGDQAGPPIPLRRVPAGISTFKLLVELRLLHSKTRGELF